MTDRREKKVNKVMHGNTKSERNFATGERIVMNERDALAEER